MKILYFSLGFLCAAVIIASAIGAFFYYYDPDIVPFIVESQYRDAIQIANQLGRLDVISIIITIFTLLFAILGFSWLSNLRDIARDTAERVAKEVADTVARKTASEYFNNKNNSSNPIINPVDKDINTINLDNAKKMRSEENNE